jgi:chemotaxis methyl-accepting protein methylase
MPAEAVGLAPAFPTERWLRLLDHEYGLDLERVRFPLLLRRIESRMSALGIRRPDDYYRYAATGRRRLEECELLLEAVVNHETSFFRHRPSFDALGTRILPEMARRKALLGENRIRMWSAGCSTGEEAYSLAYVAQRVLDRETWRVSVLGSDICAQALAVARAGRYAALARAKSGNRRLLGMPEEREASWFEISSQLRSSVRFSRFNLRKPDHRWPVGQDVIFCHNVLIHVRRSLRPVLAVELYHRLAPGGVLCFAPGEVLRLDVPTARTLYLGEAVMFQRPTDGEPRRLSDA